jgi:hypothetical protein
LLFITVFFINFRPSNDFFCKIGRKLMRCWRIRTISGISVAVCVSAVAIGNIIFSVPTFAGVSAVVSADVQGPSPVVIALVEFLLLLLSLILPASLLHIAGFSTVTDFPTDSGGPAAVDIAADAIPDVVGLLAYCY